LGGGGSVDWFATYLGFVDLHGSEGAIPSRAAFVASDIIHLICYHNQFALFGLGELNASMLKGTKR